MGLETKRWPFFARHGAGFNSGSSRRARASLAEARALIEQHDLTERLPTLNHLQGWLSVHLGAPVQGLPDEHPESLTVRGVAALDDGGHHLLEQALQRTPASRDTTEAGRRWTWLALGQFIAGIDPSPALAQARSALQSGWDPEASELLKVVESRVRGTSAKPRWAAGRLAQRVGAS